MMRAGEVCRLIAADKDPRSGWVREASTGKLHMPLEFFVASSELWVLADGRRVLWWKNGEYFGKSFRFVDAWRIAQAVYARGERL